MRGVVFVGLMGSVGCQSLLGIDDLQATDTPGADAAPEVGPDSGNCVGSGLLKVCPVVLPTQPLTLTGPIDTSNDGRCLPVISGNVPTCALLATSIEVPANATARAVGDRPLVLVAMTTIKIEGTLDVASRFPADPGAGALSGACVPGVTPGNGNGGGFGGSFGGTGGRGGASPQDPGGAPGQPTPLTEVRGGCSGSNGGNAGSPGMRGFGGGAVYLIAGMQIAVGGSINASGAAGGGGGSAAAAGGGGGAGSGGLVGLDAPLITVTGEAFANGGGGGGGGSPLSGGAGAGTESTAAFSQGAGGLGDAPGGAGNSANQTDGGEGKSSNTGGGGGGAAGQVSYAGTLQPGGRFSPAPVAQKE